MTSTDDRSERTRSFRLTERDYAIMWILALCGALTAEQISHHRFPAGPEHNPYVTHANCQLRLKLLRGAGLIRRVERYQVLSEGRKPYLYTLTAKGAKCLAAWRGCEVADLPWRKTDTRLRPNYVEHLVLTNDIRLAVMKAVEHTPGMQLLVWHDELTLAKTQGMDKIQLKRADGSAEAVSLIPDAYFVLERPDGQRRHHFLEIDRGSETAVSANERYRTWARKVHTYNAYLYGGLYEARYGTHTGRVLTVTTSEERLARLRDVGAQAGAHERFWYTTHTEATRSVVHLVQRPQQEQQEKWLVPTILEEKIWVHAGNTGQEPHALCEKFWPLRD